MFEAPRHSVRRAPGPHGIADGFGQAVGEGVDDVVEAVELVRELLALRTAVEGRGGHGGLRLGFGIRSIWNRMASKSGPVDGDRPATPGVRGWAASGTGRRQNGEWPRAQQARAIQSAAEPSAPAAACGPESRAARPAARPSPSPSQVGIRGWDLSRDGGS